jgi:hypothetical protein
LYSCAWARATMPVAAKANSVETHDFISFSMMNGAPPTTRQRQPCFTG